ARRGPTARVPGATPHGRVAASRPAARLALMARRARALHGDPDAPLRVALLGLGTVGREVAARLVDDEWRARGRARGIVPPPLVLDLAANRISGIRGIVNGTTNLILSMMARDGGELADALGHAQAQGYAEADPTVDVDGIDAADKLAILCRLAYGAWPDVGSI